MNISASPYVSRQGPRTRADGRPARPRRALRDRLLRAGRRPGRAGLRRALVRRRPHGCDGRAGPAVRGGAHDLQRRRHRGRCSAAARHPSARRRLRVAAEVDRLGAFLTARPGYEADPPSWAVAPVLDPTPRCTARSCSEPATTSARTAFAQVVLGLSGGDRLRARGVRRGATPWRRTRHLRDDAVPLHVDGHLHGRRRARAPPRRHAARAPDRRRLMAAYEAQLASPFAGAQPDLTEENLQARIRGNVLMALSNKFGWLVLTTGNKSEMAVGYSTLYGDSAGGFAVIKDVPKTLVYRLAECAQPPSRARRSPRAILTRPPSAELRARPDRRGLAAALRDPRPYPRGIRRAGSRPRAADRARLRAGRRRP